MRSARVLGTGDEEALEAFLVSRADTSMFLRSNLRRFGITDRGQTFQGTYAATLESGRVEGVAAHYRNGILVIQAPDALAGSVASAAVRDSGRPVKGLVGPTGAVRAARTALGLAAAVLDEEEDLFVLDLALLAVPPALDRGDVACRHPHVQEGPFLTRWRVEYHVEALHATRGAELETRCRSEIEGLIASRDCWVLADGDGPVAFTAFNARLPEIVQVGGVYTPPALRGRGYARTAVAGSLLEARSSGVSRAVLFTSNPPARRAYEALGFRRTGSYALLLFEEGVSHGRPADDPRRNDA